MAGHEKAARGRDGRGKALDREKEQLFTVLVYVDELLDRRFDEGFELRSITLKPPDHERNDWFVVVRAVMEGESLVGFHGATTLREAIAGTINRIDNRSMKWRPDEYA